ncbi:MAG: hypothetical protein HGA85_08970 [Nanoarchaeota archaeon]|nr:hypothetical protein [Nanoarchaeota archaeon]
MKKKKNSNLNKIMMGLVAFIFIASSVAYVVLNRQDTGSQQSTNTLKLTYNNIEYSFERKQSEGSLPYIEVTGGLVKFVTFYFPDALSNFPIDQASRDRLKSSSQFVIIFDPESLSPELMDMLRLDIRQNTPRLYSDAMIKQSDLYELPVMGCSDAAASGVVALNFIESNTTSIIDSGGCVNITYSSNPYEFYRLRDYIVYTMNGIDIA